MACIYYIKHKETGRTYIGQTVQTLEQRMRQHLAGNTEIDRALQSLGITSFEYGIIEQCKSEELDEKEIYYIAKYDTYYNGYNNQLGGRKTGQNKYDSIIENIRQDYINGMSMIDLNIKYKISNYEIRYFVRDLKKKAIIDNKTNIHKIVIGYTKEWKRIGIFESIKEALQFVNNQRQKEGKPVVDERNFYRTIKTACAKNGIASGYRWQYAEDVFYNGLQFNSSIDKYNYMIGIDYTCVNNIIFCENKENKECTKHRKLIDVEMVRNLAKEHTNIEIANILGCNIDALNRVARKNNITFKKLNRTSENDQLNKEIFNYIQSGYTYGQLAKMYNLDYNAVRARYNRYLKKHNIIKEDKRLVNGVTCIELNKSFNTLNDAARYIKGDMELPSEMVKACAYNISVAARNGTKYKGYHWKINDKQ